LFEELWSGGSAGQENLDLLFQTFFLGGYLRKIVQNY